MTPPNDDNTSSLSQSTTIIITIAIALVILAAIGIAHWLISSSPGTDTVVGPTTPEAWPSPPPTFTPTSSPTPRGTFPPTATATPTSTPTPKPPPPWNELGNLTSIEYPQVRTVVEVERRRSGVGGILGSDRILLMAVGRILIGVDLAQIEDEDVQISGNTLKVVLPHATITSVELLPEQSLIYDSEKSWIFSEYEGLEIEALDQARKQLEEETLRNEGMMELGELLAKLQLTEFLRQTGFEEVEITFK